MDSLTQCNTPGNSIGSCDACKRRKVKCDATSPCANCRISQLPCKRQTRRLKRGRPAKLGLRNLNQDSSQERNDRLVDDEPRNGSKSPQSILADDLPVFPVHAARVASGTSLSPAPASIEDGNHSLDGFSDHQILTVSPRDEDDPREALSPVRSATTPLSRNLASPSVPSPTTSYIIPHNEFTLHPAEILQRLVSAVSEDLTASGETIVTHIHRCIDLFMQYLFPNTPVTQESSLRSSAGIFDPGSSSMLYRSSQSISIEFLRSFTQITALCALVTSAIPQHLLPGPKRLIWPFYHASRAMLRLYEEQDIAYPQSSSYCIRTWQSAALQNTTGHDWPSWQIHCEGAILAVRDRLYDENHINTRPRVEAQLLRVNFWLLYLADKTAAAFEACPYVINDDLLPTEPKLWTDGDEELLLDQTKAYNQNSLESRLLVGFHLKGRLWATAADVIRQIRIFARQRGEHQANRQTARPSLTKLIDLYSFFVGLIDGLPSWLRSPQSTGCNAERDIAEYQTACFWAQRSNIMSVYHCMRIVILQRCVENDIPGVVGLNDQVLSWTLQKLEIARDFLREVQIAPFLCYQVQGEPAVERVRRVGSILLEIVINAPDPTIKERAQSQIDQLLDILARLDSKASDDLQISDSSIIICQ